MNAPDTMTELGIHLMKPEYPDMQIEPAPTGDVVELDRWIERQLRKLSGISVEQQRNSDTAKAEVAHWTDWADEENAVLQRKADWITAMLLQATLGYNYGTKKSRRLPSGSFGTRINPSKLDIWDKHAALAFSLNNDIAVRDIPAREEPDSAALKQWAESTGLPPDGCEFVPEFSKFFAKPAEQK